MNNIEELLYTTISTAADDEYPDILLYVQKNIVHSHMKDLNEYLTKRSHFTEQILKTHIGRYLDDKTASTPDLITRVFEDMTSYGFLNKYFADSQSIEEININAWDGAVIVTYCNGQKVYLDEHFVSPEQAVSMFQRMAIQTDRELDEKSPKLVTYLGKNIRVAVAIAPLVDEEVAVIASIRFIHPNKFDKDTLITNGSLTEDMFNMLSCFINNGVSMGFCGDTGSGKTTIMNTVLDCVKDRLLTLEDGMREFDLVDRDAQGKVINDVVHLRTRTHKNKDFSIGLEELLDFILRCNPSVVCVGEMVSEESFIAQEIARTGHTVISSMHTKSAALAYDRMYTLALRKHELSKDTLLDFFVQAFPVIVYMEKYADGKRRVKEIIEATGVSGGNVVYNTLYQYIKYDNVKDESGKVISIKGEFERCQSISETLYQRLIDGEMTRAEIATIMGGDDDDV